VWAPTAGQDAFWKTEMSCPTRIRTSDRPARTQVAMLLRLRSVLLSRLANTLIK